MNFFEVERVNIKLSKAPKPLKFLNKNLTKEEREEREEQEQRLKGKNDKVYKVPPKTKKEIAAIYKNLVKELKEADILNNLDVEVLMNTANAIYRMKEAREILNELGSVIRTYRTVKDKEGNIIGKELDSIFKNPAVQVEKDYQNIFHQGCLQLGLSPSARAKLSIIKMENKDNQETTEDKVFG